MASREFQIRPSDDRNCFDPGTVRCPSAIQVRAQHGTAHDTTKQRADIHRSAMPGPPTYYGRKRVNRLVPRFPRRSIQSLTSRSLAPETTPAKCADERLPPGRFQLRPARVSLTGRNLAGRTSWSEGADGCVCQ